MPKILVIGDIMLDVHIDCSSDRLSPEAPVPICNFKDEIQLLGGASNVAAQLSVNTKMIMAYIHSCCTSEIDYEFHGFKMRCNPNIKLWPLVTKRKYKIPEKERIWANGQQVCRIDNELSYDELTKLNFYNDDRNRWLESLKECIIDENIKLIIFSDYNKGTLTDIFIQEIIDYAHQKDIITILDPKRPTYPNLKNLSIVTPNNAEMEKTILSPKQLSAKLTDTYMLHTQGAEGMTCYQYGSPIMSVPAHKVDVADTCGAGDCVIAFLALILSKYNFKLNNNTMKIAMEAASLAASKVVQHKGSYVLSNKECEEVFNFCGEI